MLNVYKLFKKPNGNKFGSTQALNLDLDSLCIYDSVFDYGI